MTADLTITNATGEVPSTKLGTPCIAQLVSGGVRTDLSAARMGTVQGSLEGVVWHRIGVVSDEAVAIFQFLTPFVRADGDAVIHIKWLAP